jgi:hypothetical protein
VEDELDELFGALAAIALEGPEGVGKSAAGLERAVSVLSSTGRSSAATPGDSDMPAKSTVLQYREMLNRVLLLDQSDD